MAEAKDKSSQAAEQRAGAAKVRITAAQAALDARRAFLLAARRRGAEAFRIRTALNRPLFSLDIPGNTAALARKEHTRQLELAFKAYRELVRFYISIGAPEPTLSVLPDEMWGVKHATWGGVLKEWLDKNTENFRADGVVTTSTETLEYDLTPRQIAAITSIEGFRLIGRPSGEEVAAQDVPLFRIGLSETAMSLQYRSIFEQHGIDLTADAQHQEPSTVVNRIQQRIATLDEKHEPKHTWTIADAEEYKIIVEDDLIEVLQRREYRTMLADRIIEGLAETHLDDGRIVGIFLTIPDRKNPTQLLRGSDYTLEAEHLGDVFLSDRVVKLRFARTLQRMLPDRYFFIGKDEQLGTALLTAKKLAEAEGDPGQLAIQGLPIAGTTILRLIAQGGREFEQVKLRVLYKYYTYTRLATASPGSSTDSGIA